MTKVSVLIPVFNHEAFIGSAIQTVLEQTSPPLEILVIDDGSTDGTADVVRTFGSRVAYVKKPNGGCPSALNVGLRQARGEWIAWLSSDDRWLPGKLEKQLAALAAHPAARLCYTDDYLVDEAGKRIAVRSTPNPKGRVALNAALIRRCFIDGSSILAKRDDLLAEGGFREDDPFSHDYRMWLRLARRGGFCHVAEPLVESRIHLGQVSTRVRAMELASKRAAFGAARHAPTMGAVMGILLRVLDEIALLPLRTLGPLANGGRIDPMALHPWEWNRLAAAGRLREGVRRVGDSLSLLVRPEVA